MTLPLLLAVLVRGLELAGLAVVVGGLALEVLVLPAAAAPGAPLGGRRLRRLITAGVVVLVLTTCAELAIRAQTMSRAPLASAIATIPSLVTETHFGGLLAARLGLLVLALALSLAHAAVTRVLCLILAHGVVLTLSLTGHAADWGDLTASIAVDWAHAVAASTWTGGLLVLALVIVRRHPELATASPSFAAMASRFSRLAGLCLLVVLVTGLFNAWTQLGALSRLWTTAYGRVLIGKVMIVAGLAWLGAINRYGVLPRLHRRAASGWAERAYRLSRLVVRGSRRPRRSVSAPAELARYVAGEAGLAAVVFVCTAVLGEITPGRHVAFERKPTTHVTNIQPRASVDRPRPGTVTPPAGDAARGRAVFVRLKCFTCHAVDGERFPAATRPGPNLTGAGGHPSGYLIESIMNPNAMILDGPGYTDDRGLSIMPEYRQSMTIGDVIDVVSYLKSLGGAPPAPDASLAP